MECTLFLAEGCNFKCRYCYEGVGKQNGLMSKEVVENALHFIVENSLEDETIHLVLLGGEPLLNKDAFFHVFETINSKYKAIKKRFNLKMTTKGTLIDDNVIQVMQTEEMDISISIDGKRETQTLNRMPTDGQEKYPIILKNIQNMMVGKIPFNIRMTVSNNNVMNMYENVKYFLEMKVENVYISFDYYADWKPSELLKLDEQMLLLDELYIKEIAFTKKKVINLYDFKYTTFLVKRPVVFCSAGSLGHFVVDWNGKIFPCGYAVGEDIWQIGDISTGIDRHKFKNSIKQNIEKNDKCDFCEIAFSCLGTRCGFLNYKRNGKLNRPAKSTCMLEKILFRHNLNTFQKLYSKKCPRLMNYIKIAKEHRLEPNNCVKNMFE